MTNDERNPKPECPKDLSGEVGGCVLRYSAFIGITSFVIRIWRNGAAHQFKNLELRPARRRSSLPRFGARQRLGPACAQNFSRGRFHGGNKAAIDLPLPGDFRLILPEADRQSRQ